jgi:transposase
MTTTGDENGVPQTEVLARPKRRSYSAAYKRQIVDEAAALKPEERSMLLRREGLYSSHLSQWRVELGRTGELPEKRRGPKANLDREQVCRLERENARLQTKLRQAELIIGAQKKLAEIFGTVLPTEEEILGNKRDD